MYPESRSSIVGVAKSLSPKAKPTRLVRACVVSIQPSIRKVGIPRLLVDCIGVTTRESIVGAVALGWSGMQWQTSRPPLTPTSRNIKTGKRFSENASDRMAEMLYDIDPEGWDGDEVVVGFYGRNAVILGTIEHRWANYDLEDNAISETLEPGRRLQDDPSWFVENIADGRDLIYPARDSSHADALNFRWGQITGTAWETRGIVLEMAKPNFQSGTLFASRKAALEWSPEWLYVETRRIRLVCLDKDAEPDSDKSPVDRHYLLISDGTETSLVHPSKEELVDGLQCVVTGGDSFYHAFSATKSSGGVSKDDELACATRYPELREVIDQMQKQIDELQNKLSKAANYMVLLANAIGQITNQVAGTAALSGVGLSDASIAIPKDVKPSEDPPDEDTLDNARSGVFRVGR